jgi:hypothetical protein
MYRPYRDTDSDSGSVSDSGSDATEVTQTTGSTEEDRIAYDTRFQSMEDWRAAANSWINTPTAQPTPTTILTPAIQNRTIAADMRDIDTELRARDVARHIINIDSMFRESPESSTSSDYYFRLLTPIRNVLRVRVTAIEFPNNYPFFTEARRNMTIGIAIVSSPGIIYNISIPTGNYSAGDMTDILNSSTASFVDLSGMLWRWNDNSGKFSVSGPNQFALCLPSNTTSLLYYPREFGYGLAYYLGFTYNRASPHLSKYDSSTTSWKLSSDQCANFAGDSYVFLKINDFDCVTQTTEENDFTALAKIVIREPKNYMSYDDYGSQHIKEVVFHNPRDISRLKIQILDPFGDPVEFCGAHMSFSLELLEIRNQSLYESVRDSILLRYV